MPLEPIPPKTQPIVRIAIAGVAAMLISGCTVVLLESPKGPQHSPQTFATDAVPLTPESGVPDAEAVNPNQGWAGHYEGETPCADCAGVHTLLTLNRDGSYILSISYKGSNRLPDIMRGSFAWGWDYTEITLDEKGGHRRYVVGWQELRPLNRDGSLMRGVQDEPIALRKRPE